MKRSRNAYKPLEFKSKIFADLFVYTGAISEPPNPLREKLISTYSFPITSRNSSQIYAPSNPIFLFLNTIKYL